MSYLAAKDGIIGLLRTSSGIGQCHIVSASDDKSLADHMRKHATCLMVAYAGDIADDAASGVVVTDVTQLYLVMVGVSSMHESAAGDMLMATREALVGKVPSDNCSPLRQYVVNNQDGKPYYAGSNSFYPMYFVTRLRLTNNRR